MAEVRGSVALDCFASQPYTWTACKPWNRWPGALFTTTAGGELALSWLSIKVVGHCHLGFVSMETKSFSVFYTFHVGYTCQLQLSHGCGICSKLEVLMMFKDRPAVSINNSLSFLFCLQHFLSACTLERFPWRSNLTDIFSAVDYFCKFGQSRNCSDNCSVSLVIFQSLFVLGHTCHLVGNCHHQSC